MDTVVTHAHIHGSITIFTRNMAKNTAESLTVYCTISVVATPYYT